MAKGEDWTRRGMPKGRIEALSDGVFAIAMTLLAFNIRVPEGDPAAMTSERLEDLLIKLWPHLTSFVI